MCRDCRRGCGRWRWCGRGHASFLVTIVRPVSTTARSGGTSIYGDRFCEPAGLHGDDVQPSGSEGVRYYLGNFCWRSCGSHQYHVGDSRLEWASSLTGRRGRGFHHPVNKQCECKCRQLNAGIHAYSTFFSADSQRGVHGGQPATGDGHDCRAAAYGSGCSTVRLFQPQPSTAEYPTSWHYPAIPTTAASVAPTASVTSATFAKSSSCCILEANIPNLWPGAKRSFHLWFYNLHIGAQQ